MVAAHEDTSWITELKEYILKGTLPADDTEAERVARQAKVYIIHDRELYQKHPNGVALRCISKEEGELLLKDVHAGKCGHLSSGRTLVGKAYRQGFFWPSVLQDAKDLVKTCEACQFHAKQIHQPAQELHTCRHSGNQGTTGRPARAHDILRKISLRTRLSKPGEPREGFLLARDLSMRGHQGSCFRSC